MLQQDGASIHSAHNVTEYLSPIAGQLMPWPSQSPDLSIIENFWAIIKYRVARKRYSNRVELIEVIRDEWSQIGADPNHKILRALCESMPRRL